MKRTHLDSLDVIQSVPVFAKYFMYLFFVCLFLYASYISLLVARIYILLLFGGF